MLPNVLELFASFVRFEKSDDEKNIFAEKHAAVFDAVPDIYVKLAQRCRSDHGYRLLRRMLRHTYDCRTESLDDRKASLICCDGKIGICVSMPMPASMKKDIYPGVTVMTKDKLLAASCSCMSGGDEFDKSQTTGSACVHVLPHPFALTKLLAEDLAKHILLELSSRLTSADIEDSTWSKAEIDSMKESLYQLMLVSGELSLQYSNISNVSLFSLLEGYCTGTQRMKEWNRANAQPKKNEIGPVASLLCFDSPEYKSKLTLRKTKAKPETESKEKVVHFDPNYVQICTVLKAMDFDFGSSDFIGHKLLNYRRAKQMKNEKAKLKDADADADYESIEQSKVKEA